MQLEHPSLAPETPSSQRRSRSLYARFIGLGFIVALGLSYILIGHSWYYDGKMVLCSWEEIAKPTSWCHKPTTEPAGIHESYHGLHRWFNDDIFANFFSDVRRLLDKWFAEWAYGWFWPEFAPRWNAFFSGDDPVANAHRVAFGAIVVIFYGALVSRVIGSLFDWTNGE